MTLPSRSVAELGTTSSPAWTPKRGRAPMPSGPPRLSESARVADGKVTLIDAEEVHAELAQRLRARTAVEVRYHPDAAAELSAAAECTRNAVRCSARIFQTESAGLGVDRGSAATCRAGPGGATFAVQVNPLPYCLEFQVTGASPHPHRAPQHEAGPVRHPHSATSRNRGQYDGPASARLIRSAAQAPELAVRCPREPT